MIGVGGERDMQMALEDAKTEIDTAFTRKGTRGHSFENAFAGATSFLRRSYTKDLSGVDLAITGVPFDQATSHRAGTRFGPRAIREASALNPYDPPHGWPDDPLEAMSIIDYGDLAFDYARTAAFPAALTAHIRGILAAGAGTVTLGGDHFITLPILRAYAERFGPLGVIHFDAHSDLWPDDDAERIDHGTFLYKAVRAGLVDPARSVQIGIRTTTADYLGVNVITEKDAFTHVSGHPNRDELKKMYGWVRPKYSIPVHGEARHLEEHAEFAMTLGVEDAIAPRNGDLIRLAPGEPEVIDEVPAGRWLLDGNILTPEGAGPMRERRKLPVELCAEANKDLRAADIE